MLVGLPDRWGACSRTIPVEGEPSAFAHWGDLIAVGLGSCTVVLLDAITGSRKSVLSGHADTIVALAFSLDGTLLVSGSEDRTLKLWDVRSGRTVRTFGDHPSAILTVSISLDRTEIASGTEDGTVHLWHVGTGRCHPTPLCHDGRVTGISFSPIDSRRLISSSWDRTIRLWDVGGHQIGAPYHEAGRVAHVAYAPDGTRFVSCGGRVATVRDSESGVVVAKLNPPNQCVQLRWCCFSPNGRFVACVAADAIYVWEIASSGANLVGHLVGHSKPIISTAFSSFLISASPDRSVRVWQGNGFLADPITANDVSAQLGSAPIESVHPFAEDGVVVTIDSSGVVKIYDLTTGTCKSSFPTPAKGIQDTQLAGDTLIVVWWEAGDRAYRVWDVGNRQLLRTVRSSLDGVSDLRISEDGAKIFGLGGECIEARWIQTGERVGRVEVQKMEGQEGLAVHGSKVWLAGSRDIGWDFGGREVSCFPLSTGFPDRPRLDLVEPSTGFTAKRACVQDTVTGRAVFYLSERYMKNGTRMRLDGRHLLVWPRSGEVVVIDLNFELDGGL